MGGLPDRQRDGCLVCGAPLTCGRQALRRTCALCGAVLESRVVCARGHFVCDRCHTSGAGTLLPLLLNSGERDPIRLFLQAADLPSVHLHGPEHHAVVPAVLLTAFHNCGGRLDLRHALSEALRRGGQIPGGACGYLGVCGAAAGTGIYASILTGATPLSAGGWSLPQQLTARCLEHMAAVGGPRCCKRTSRLAIETAAEFTREHFGIAMPLEQPPCAFSGRNRECIGSACPFFPAG